MTDRREIWRYVPNPAKVGKHGVSIDAPTPKTVRIPDPWKRPVPGSADAGPRDRRSNDIADER